MSKRLREPLHHLSDELIAVGDRTPRFARLFVATRGPIGLSQDLVEGLSQKALHAHAGLGADGLQKPIFPRRQVKAQGHLPTFHVSIGAASRYVHTCLPDRVSGSWW